MSKPEENEELDYEAAPGSGAAAVLAFMHIAASGVLAYGSYYLLRYASEGLLASWNLSWQFFFPMGLGLLLYLPTNPLSKALATTALGLAVLGALATGVSTIMVLTDPARQVDVISTGRMLGTLSASLAGGLFVAFLLRLWFRRLLPERDPSLV